MISGHCDILKSIIGYKTLSYQCCYGGGGGGGWKYKQEPDEKETKKHLLKISENGNREGTS
jgi:hypothetical protein